MTAQRPRPRGLRLRAWILGGVDRRSCRRFARPNALRAITHRRSHSARRQTTPGCAAASSITTERSDSAARNTTLAPAYRAQSGTLRTRPARALRSRLERVGAAGPPPLPRVPCSGSACGGRRPAAAGLGLAVVQLSLLGGLRVSGQTRRAAAPRPARRSASRESTTTSGRSGARCLRRSATGVHELAVWAVEV